MERLKKFLAGVVKSQVPEVVRGYLVKRLKSVSAGDLVKAIESNDWDVLSKASEEDRRLLKLIVDRLGPDAVMSLLDAITPDLVFAWLSEDLPFIAGVIFGHPKGVGWLRSVVEGFKKRVAEMVGGRLVLVPLEQGSEQSGEGAKA